MVAVLGLRSEVSPPKRTIILESSGCTTAVAPSTIEGEGPDVWTKFHSPIINKKEYVKLCLWKTTKLNHENVGLEDQILLYGLPGCPITVDKYNQIKNEK